MEDLNWMGTVTPWKNNQVTYCPLACFIRCTNNMVVVLDPDDWCRLHKFTWYAKKSRGGWYAYRKTPAGPRFYYQYMHREITACPKGYHVHHRNCLTLDNRKHNLEVIEPKRHEQLTRFRRLARMVQSVPPGH